MKEESITSVELRKVVRLLSTYPLERLIIELPKVHPRAAEEILQKKAKDLGKNPQCLIALIKIAEKFPELQFVIDKIKLIETPHLDFKAAKPEFNSEVPDSLRELKNVVLHRYYSTFKKSSTASGKAGADLGATTNPKSHEDDPIEDLITYLLENSASAFHFLRQPHRQKELAEKPLLIAKMIAGNGNLRKTIDKEKACFLPEIPTPIQKALIAFSETIILLSTPQLKNNMAVHPSFMQEGKSLVEISSENFFPEKEIYTLNHRVKEAVIHDIDLMLAKLPDSETKSTLQKRFYALQKAQGISQLKTDPYGLQLHEEVKDAATKFDALIKIRSLLQDPLLRESEQFNQLRPELERLNENSSLSEITHHNTKLTEIKVKNNCLRQIYTLINEIKEKESELAEEFRRLASDFDETSQQKPMDTFIEKLKTTKVNINLLSKAHADLTDPLLANHPALASLQTQFSELNVSSKKFEFDNFNRALKEVRKLAAEVMSMKEKTLEERSASQMSSSFSKKLRSSMDKPAETHEDTSESSPTSSYSELEIYKGSPPPRKI